MIWEGAIRMGAFVFEGFCDICIGTVFHAGDNVWGAGEDQLAEILVAELARRGGGGLMGAVGAILAAGDRHADDGI